MATVVATKNTKNNHFHNSLAIYGGVSHKTVKIKNK